VQRNKDCHKDWLALHNNGGVRLLAYLTYMEEKFWSIDFKHHSLAFFLISPVNHQVLDLEK
jgi:hypothetical protein